jgi:hypothetical protein
MDVSVLQSPTYVMGLVNNSSIIKLYILIKLVRTAEELFMMTVPR